MSSINYVKYGFHFRRIYETKLKLQLAKSWADLIWFWLSKDYSDPAHKSVNIKQ